MSENMIKQTTGEGKHADNRGKELWDSSLEGISEYRQIRLGSYYSYSIDHDIKHLGFVLARYKFAAKMLFPVKSGGSVLELGCNQGIGGPFFCQAGADRYLGIDFDTDAVKAAKETFSSEEGIYFLEDDFLNKDYRSYNNGKKADAVVSIDVVEHIYQDREEDFLKTIQINLKDNGVAVIGTPNIGMLPYASVEGQKGHVNMFDQKRLYEFLKRIFENVFIFGMNDEVIHTGFYPMSCYIMALCAGLKQRKDYN